MCGFAGFVGAPGPGADAWQRTLRAMGDAVAHRGPDDSGTWFDPEASVGLVHRRLAIVDLSSAGHQPMKSASGRFVLVFNGEIYNHLELRAALAGSGWNHAWRGHSDTETILAGFEHWGLEATLRAALGMFSLALWDRQERSVKLARDRMGEKPLYYGWQNRTLLFGSELKALKAHPAFSAQVDRNALALQLRHNYIPAPHSIYAGIQKLPAGTWIAADGRSENAQPIAYWSMHEAAEKGLATPLQATPGELTEALNAHLRAAVGSQLMSDVPLGAFLSGGVDSSLVVALMQDQSAVPVKTFTIGFEEQGYDEAPHAKAVARHLGTDHTELYVTSRQALDVIPSLPRLYDEPFADSSQIPTYLLARMTRKHVTVSLSGDGGDELFAGYGRYRLARSIWEKTTRVPSPVRRAVAGGLQSIQTGTWDAMAKPFSKLLPRSLRARPIGDRVHKLAALLGHREPHWLYRDMMSHWKNPDSVVLHARESPVAMTAPQTYPHFGSFERHMMYADSISYLPDDILVKVDRAAMGVSLETRVPLLDHRVVEFAARLPLSVLIHGSQGKWILREVLQRYVPKALIERPKMGFGIPLDQWLRGPLREWAEAMLSPARLRREGFFNPEPIFAKWTEHLSGQRNWQNQLWTVLMFQAWLAEQQP